MITNDVDDRNDQITYKSIFPKLEKLEIWDCKDLEFLFPSTLLGGLKNLKFLTIKNAPELKYIFGKYPLEDHLLNLNQNDELQFDLPALEVLCLGDVQKIISICAMNYYLTWPSLHMVVLDNCNIESFTDLMVCSDEGRLKWKAMKELDASRGGIPPFQASQNPLLQPLNNIRTMRLVSCSRLVSLLALPIASKILLEVLIIEECHELKCIVADEEDAQALMNFNSIFSKLKELNVSRCRTLEYLFPASLFRSPTHLKYVTIAHAPKLKYLFGTSHHEDSSHESQNIEAYIDFPVLESLNLEVIPNLVSIFPQNYYLTGLSLKSIVLDMSPEFIIKSFTNFMSGRHASQCDSTTSKVIENRIQTMTDLTVHYSNVEDIFNLAQSKFERNREGLEPVTSSLEYLTLGNLSELRNICEGPKYILSLNNLKKLNITSCKKLKTVFSISILRSLPELWKLEISDCEELVHIVGEDIEENASDRLSHEPCFPKLHELHVKSCNMLKYLFSISMSGILPNLMFLSIKEASKLKHVIISHVEMKEMVMTDVLPELYYLIFEELPSLVDVCHGIDFQAVRISSEVYNCPNFSFYENSTTHLQVGLGNLDSKVQVAKDENLSSHLNTHQFGMRKAEGSQDLETQQSSIGSPNLTRVVEVTPKEGPSSNTSHPCPLDSTKPMALVPMSPILIALPTEGSSFTIIEIFEEEEEEEGGLITICRCRRGIKEVSSLIPEDPQITCRGAPLPLINAPLLETSIQEGSDQDDVGTTNQLIREAVDTIQVSKNSNALAIVPSKDGNVETIGPLTTFFEHASDGITEEVSLVQNECEVNSSCFDDDEITRESDASSFDELLRDNTSGHGGQVNRSGDFGASLSALEGRERESSYSKGRPIKYGMKKLDVQVLPPQLPSPSPLSSSLETTPPFSMTDYVLTVPGVQEIVNMMNLEGVEPFLLAKVFKSHPQLRLPTENRSTRILCFSYRVLLDILNILATRTPLSITESDKRLLVENLEDASTLGFDNNWLVYQDQGIWL